MMLGGVLIKVVMLFRMVVKDRGMSESSGL